MTGPILTSPLAATVLTTLVALQVPARRPLPAAPPMNGPGWTVVVPAILFLIAAAGTWALWRHFADQDDDDE